MLECNKVSIFPYNITTLDFFERARRHLSSYETTYSNEEHVSNSLEKIERN